MLNIFQTEGNSDIMKKVLSFFIAAALLVSALGISAFASAETDEGAKIFALRSHITGAAAAIDAYDSKYTFDTPVTRDELSLIMKVIFNEYPQFSYLSSSYKYSYSGDNVLSVIFNYTVSEDESIAMKNVIYNWISEVVSFLPDDAGKLETALFFHDYIVNNFDYDQSLTHRTLYDFITLGVGVCQAYTLAYNALLSAADIDVSWASSSEMNHVWNLVCLDGKWYHADVTWDDSVGSVPGSTSHTYFLLSDSKISQSGYNHYAWVSPYSCTDQTYDTSYISSVSSSFARIGDTVYYMSADGIFGTSDVSLPGTLQKGLDLIWNTWGGSAYYTSKYSSLVAYDGKLYFNSATEILAYDPETQTVETIYTYRGGDGYIYGFGASRISDEELSLFISKTPSTADGSYVTVSIKKSTLIGDANGNGNVRVDDAVLVLKYVARWEVTLREDLADVDGDGKITLSDALAILKIIVSR